MIPAYASYKYDPNDNYVWKHYTDFNTNEWTIFWNIDKVKLTWIMIDELIIPTHMESNGFITGIFPCHDF